MGIISRRLIPDSCSDIIVYKALSRLVALRLPDSPEVGMMNLGPREVRGGSRRPAAANGGPGVEDL